MLVSYNWLYSDVRDVIAYAESKGMGVSVMNPVSGGLLVADTPNVMRLLPGAKTPAEIGFRYTLATKGVTSVLSGMNTMEQIDENVRIADRSRHLTPLQEERMIGRLKTFREKAKRTCSACGYCMPCAHGVNIPANFSSRSRAEIFGLVNWAKIDYNALSTNAEGDASAAACKKCGKCEPKCPNNVPIIKQLEEAAKVLG